MDALFLLGRVLFAAVFVAMGVALLAPWLGRAQTPARLSGAAAGAASVLIGSGSMIALGLWADLGALLAAAAVLAATVQRHRFWRHPAGPERGAHLTHLLKNVALIGAALILVFVYNELGEAAPSSLTGPLF